MRLDHLLSKERTGISSFVVFVFVCGGRRGGVVAVPAGACAPGRVWLLIDGGALTSRFGLVPGWPVSTARPLFFGGWAGKTVFSGGRAGPGTLLGF